MKKTIISLSIALLGLIFIACDNKNQTGSEKQNVDSTISQNASNMNSYVSILEIPVTDISRAIKFYQVILDITIEKFEMPGMEMGLLPYEEQVVTAVLVKGEGYEPSSKGVTIYLNAGENLQVMLDKVEKNGGKIITPKTPHADESGFFALFLDSEGNKMGLHSSY